MLQSNSHEFIYIKMSMATMQTNVFQKQAGTTETPANYGSRPSTDNQSPTYQLTISINEVDDPRTLAPVDNEIHYNMLVTLLNYITKTYHTARQTSSS